MQDLNFDGKITISDYKAFIGKPYNVLVDTISKTEPAIFLELEKDGIVIPLLVVFFLLVAFGVLICLGVIALCVLYALIGGLIGFIVAIPTFLIKLPGRLTKEFTTFKIDNLVFQATFINVLLWGFLIFSSQFRSWFFDNDVMGWVVLVMLAWNLIVFLIKNFKHLYRPDNHYRNKL